jgi:hypothetical protein
VCIVTIILTRYIPATDRGKAASAQRAGAG